ncbi:MAG: membrane protein insertase YidC [Firmicutes bacterium]|nr:membrane protein insertase YidC [Candidatus Caballimonas caccae]
MGNLISYISIPFGYIMKWCWWLCGNYGLAIVLFTLLTKIIFLPISLWIQKNSIAMVKIQPEVNLLKAKYMGNKDVIADKQAELYKKEHYHPLLSIIPLVIQLFLIIVIVEIIYHPLSYVLGYSTAEINAICENLGLSTSSISYELSLMDKVTQGALLPETIIEGIDIPKFIDNVNNFDVTFLTANVLVNPNDVWGFYVIAPILTCASSALLSILQNYADVLQREQSKGSQYAILIVTLGVSLYFGIDLPTGIAVYWVASNIFSIIQMYILNFIMNPKKYVDYEALENSRKVLDEANSFGKEDKHDPLYKEKKAKEKADYKKFKNITNKHFVIYSEKSGFYKYYQGIIENLLKKSNIIIHYVTNDYNDRIFEIAKTEPRIKPYYISIKKLSLLMMVVDCDVFVMTTPDLDKYYLKRSLVRKDIEYIYVPHDMMSTHMSFREGAFDNFDTIFCAGKHIVKEMKATEKVYNLKEKKLVEFGYPLADELVKSNENIKTDEKKKVKDILIAPSWQEDNLLDSCIDTLIEKLYCKDYKIIVRPHPEYVKRYKNKMDALVEKYKDYDGNHLVFELDFAKNFSIYSSDLIITDWSGVGPEFCFATKKPALFINTQMKCPNPNFNKIGLTPVEISLRDILGVSLNKEDLSNVDKTVKKLLSNSSKYKKTIADTFDNLIFNHGKSSIVGADYILETIIEKRKKKA